MDSPKNEIETNSKKNKSKSLLLLGILVLSLTTVIALLMPLLVTKLSFISLNLDKPNEIGDTIGGILGPSVGIIAVALTFLAFWAQYDANLEQRRQFNISLKEERSNTLRSQIEGRFFELIKVHIENRNSVLKSEKSFEDLIEDIQEIIFSLESIKDKFKTTLTEFEIQNLAYCIFFYGLFNKKIGMSLQHLSKVLLKKIPENASEIASSLFEALQNRQGIGLNQLVEKFQGYHDTLGHYFRHLFQTIKYINEQSSDILSYEEKYQYVKILHAQLSTFEQLLFFYNVTSELGKSWELDEKLDENHKLITKYNLIKNIPVDIISYPKIRERFPFVSYEFDIEQNAKRSLLEREYRKPYKSNFLISRDSCPHET